MLSALTIFILVADGMGNAASTLESKANLIADLNYKVPRNEARDLERSLQAKWPQTRITFVSRKQAAAQFRKTFAGNSAMLSALQGNPLPSSLQIRTRNPVILNHIAKHLRSNGRVKHLIFNPDLTHKLILITSFVRIAGIALVVGLALLALVIVVNTTHLTVEARRDEIEVMKLVGATYSFVRNPLIIEGILLGLSGALLACIVGIALYLPIMKSILMGSGSAAVALLPINTGTMFIAAVAGVVLLSGATVGATGSYISVRKFARF